MKKSPSAINVFLLLIALGGAIVWALEQFKEPKRKIEFIESKPSDTQPVLETPKEPFPEGEMVAYRQILVSYSTGDFNQALIMTERLIADASTSENFLDWLIRQRPVLLTSLGWMKIKSDECDEAVKIFYKALGFSQIPEAQKGLGYCLRVFNNWPEAASYLALYILAKPSDIEGRLMYADTLESLGRFEEAVSILEGATLLVVEPEIGSMAKAKLLAMKAKAKSGAGQKTERSENFFVSYHEDAHEGILRQVLDILESGVNEFSSVLGVAPPSSPIEVILYRKEDFFDVVPGGPGWAEGVFDGRMRVPVSNEMLNNVEGKLAVVLRHELSHAILSSRSGGRMWPTWFDEGLAQYLACRSKPCEAFRFPAKLSEFSSPVRLNSPFVTLDDVHAGSAYLHSLYMVMSIVRTRGESSLDFISSRIPQHGSLTSDFIAEAAGWSSFDDLWKEIERRWRRRFLPDPQ